jgi:RNA polymerase sigma factor (sigma-70 family)
METEGTITLLVEQLRSDRQDERDEAARIIWRRYFPELLRMARNHLDQKIRQREDEEDILQSMYKSFVVRQQRGEFDIKGRDQLWGLLAHITLNKTRNAAIRHSQKKRDIKKELRPTANPTAAENWEMEMMDGKNPTPAEAVIFSEELEQRLMALPDQEAKEIAIAKLEGWKNTEIAKARDCSVRRVERKLNQIRALWTLD